MTIQLILGISVSKGRVVFPFGNPSADLVFVLNNSEPTLLFNPSLCTICTFFRLSILNMYATVHNNIIKLPLCVINILYARKTDRRHIYRRA